MERRRRYRGRLLCHILVLTSIGIVDTRPFFHRKHLDAVFVLRGGVSDTGSAQDVVLPGTILETNMDTTRVIIETTSATSSSPDILDGSENSLLDDGDEDHDGSDSNNDDRTNKGQDNNSFESSTASEPSSKTTDVEGITTTTPSSISDQVIALRGKGKRLHDEGGYEEAASCFAAAANLLKDNADDSEDFFTLKLHQALCCLKLQDNELAIQICTEILDHNSMPIVLRARALHRRAKAYLAMGDRQDALDDARSAAMFGDVKAVELYGKLMREDRRRGMMNGAAMNTEDTTSFFSPDTLLESLISKSSSPSTGVDDDPMAAMFAIQNLFGSGDCAMSSGTSLVKSVLSSVSKRLDDDATQEMLSGYLRGVEGPQLTQIAETAGIPLNPDLATRIAKFCQNTTKKRLRKMVKLGRRLFYTGRLIRKTVKVIAKYKNVLIFSSILWWISSAITRPLPTKSIPRKPKRPRQPPPTAATTTSTTTVATSPVGLLKPKR